MIRTAMASGLALALVLSGAVVLATAPDKNAPATAADADTFVARAEKDLADISVDTNRAGWINATYITDDTDAMAAEVSARQTELAVKYAGELRRRR